jgi:hypothetical protein
MTCVLTGRPVRLVGWALPILAVLCCAPSIARASCGDYVHTRTAQPDQVMPTDGHPSTDRPDPAPADSHKPCHGPNCSGAPVVPPLSVPTVTPPTLPEWGWSAGSPAFSPPGRVGVLLDLSSPAPIQLASSIFHPPRRAI